MNKVMIIKFLLYIFICSSFVLSSTQVPFIMQFSGTRWNFTKNAIDLLMQYRDHNVHVIAIGGPTRAGKSFVMTHLLKKFHKIHFGRFPYKNTMDSVTKGMDIALVEHFGRLFLLIDCEGFDSLSRKMDERLMLIIAMISQKMIYLTENFDQRLINNLGSMLQNLNQITVSHENRFPLNTIEMVLNKTDLEDHERDVYFFQKNLKGEEKKLFDFYFKTQDVLFIGEKPENEIEDRDELKIFQRDIDTLFSRLISFLVPFNINGKNLTLWEFLQYMESEVLEKINNNQTICFPNVVSGMCKKYAENVIAKQYYVNLEPYSDYQEKNTIDAHKRYIRGLLRRFDEETGTYANFVRDIRYNYEQKLERSISIIEDTNIRKGREVKKTETKTRRVTREKLINSGFWWFQDDEYKETTYHQIRTITTYKNGTIETGNWEDSHETIRYYKK